MKSINEQALKIFSALLETLGHKDYIKLNSDGYTSLSVECIGELSCGFGTARAYSLMHIFTQNGELMRDPEMCFLHFKDDGVNILPGVFPYIYQLDRLGVRQESILFTSFGQMEVIAGLQEQHSEFANSWMANIKEQGFIN
jgi:hypothetical protein